ncbi:MAG: pseudouridine synthase [Flavobacteriales bacterium]|nr:pseudouridine synthase [Flavobacteriales bacterium]
MNTSTQPIVSTIEIIYEDEYMVVINKPNNFLIHQSHYARNIKETTLIQFLQQQLGYPIYPVHRLDRKTSGIMILIKNKDIVAQFQALFTDNSIQKTYYAIVRGFSNKSGVIDSPVKNDDTGVYKDAITHYKSIEQIELAIPVHPYEHSRYSLIKLAPKTGRMHQLRKHLNKISHPIVGDYKYGDRFHNRMFETEFRCEYLFLHAFSLDFIHPISKEKCHFEAKFPFDWHRIFDEFNWTSP